MQLGLFEVSMEADKYLKQVLADEKPCYLFVYGDGSDDSEQCFFRTHSSKDSGKNWWIKREQAEKILKLGGYVQHHFHVGTTGHAVVYVEKR